MSGSPYSGKTACEGEKFYVEVTGIKHGQEQSIQFYDLTDMTEQKALENKQEVDEKEETSVYSWDWCDETENRNVWLSVPTDTQSIKLPLFENVTSYKLRDNEQDYMLQAVVPMTLLPTFVKNSKEEERTAPLRDGYLYIAIDGKIWRELKVSTTKSGTPCFNDINLYSFRTEKDGEFKEHKARQVRKATGIELSEVFIPVKDNTSQVDVRIAYSEVQWSEQRLNYFEKNTDELKQRMQKLPYSLGKVKKLPEVRCREFIVEMLLGEPKLFNQNLDGTWVSTTYNEIKSQIQKEQKSGADAFSHYKNNPPENDPLRYELTIRQEALHDILAKENQKEWDIKKTVDYLADAKKRQLHYCVISDPLFNVRHKSYLVKSGVSYLGGVLQDASEQKYFKSAELVQRFIMPKKFGKKDNPNHDYINRHFYQGWDGCFHRTLRTVERLWCHKICEDLQKQIVSELANEEFATVLRDVGAINDANASAVYPFVGNALSSLSVTFEKLDTLSFFYTSGAKVKNNTAQALYGLLSNDGSHPLHSVLFTQDDKEIPLDGTEYKPPEGKNDGSGFCTPENIARWADKKLLIDLEHIDVVELENALLDESKDNDEEVLGFAQRRRIYTKIDGILSDYFQALVKVETELPKTPLTSLNFRSAYTALDNQNFNIVYRTLLKLLKSLGPSVLGKIEFKEASHYFPLDEVAAKKLLLIGVQGNGLKYGLTKTEKLQVENAQKNRLGLVTDENGKLVVATNKKVATKLNGDNSLSPKTKAGLVAIPEDCELAQDIDKTTTRRALNNYGKEDLNISNAYQKLGVPYFIVIVEIINIKNTVKALSSGDTLHNDITIASALTDFGVAFTNAVNHMYGDRSWFSKLALKREAQGIFAEVLSQFGFKTSMSILTGIGVFGGLLTAGIAVWDSARLWNVNDDDAAAGMLLVGVGAAISALATIAAEASVFSILGPWGFPIAILGGVIYWLCLDTPVETWLANGPFSFDPADKYQHLQDPDIAYERLIGVFMQFDLSSYELDSQVEMPEEKMLEMKQKGVTHIISVQSNFASFFNKDLVSESIFARCGVWDHTKKLHDSVSRTEFYWENKLEKIENKNIQSVCSAEAENATLYGYVFDTDKVPDNRTEKLSWWGLGGFAPQHIYEAGFDVRAQFSVNGMSFPSVPLDDSAASPKQTSSPVFDDKEHPFWLSVKLPKIRKSYSYIRKSKK